MVRQQSRQPRALGAAALAAAAFFGSLLSAPAASAQSVQIFINTAFVVSQFGTASDAQCATASPGGCCTVGTPPRYVCPISNSPQAGNNISNDPEIQFAQDAKERCNLPLTADNPNIPGTLGYNVCNDQVFLCAQVGIGQVSGTITLDEVEFEVFRFVDGANPLDPGSTPPLKTFFIDSPGSVATGQPPDCTGSTCFLPDSQNAYCVLWDGSQNIQGGTGKINGQYGFRVTVQTNQVGQSGNITITQTRAYPSGATLDANVPPNSVAQKNLLVDVSDVHVVHSTPTVVGQITGVSAEPYNFTYRLAKDSTMYLTINESIPPFANVRTVIPGLPRTGEGSLGAAGALPLVNGDSWDGRDFAGSILPPGSYLAVFQSNAGDQYDGTAADGVAGSPATFSTDLSAAVTTQISIDPLQITDIRVQPLLGGSTSLAVLSYQLTEPATVYVDIYPPGTSFCNDVDGLPALGDVNNTKTDNPTQVPAKNLSASSAGCTPTGPVSAVAPLRTIVQQQNARTSVLSFWDGRDANGNLVGDGDYSFVIYASLPSRAGQPYNLVSTDRRVWTSLAKTGFISVLRGLVGITQITPTSTVIGSSPAVAGLSPFSFRYQLSRDAIVSLKIFDSTGSKLIKTIVNQETRPGLFNNSDTWTDGTDDNGLMVASGTYLVQLTATDGSFPANVSTTTALFPLDNFRITDLGLTPLLAGASDQVTLTYQLSQPMFIAWNIYPAGSVIVNSTGSWPPCAAVNNPPGSCTSSSVVSPGGQPVAPIVTFKGMRAGRLKISEFWDGRDINGLFVPDGSYVYTLTAQSTTTPQYFPTDRVSGAITVARGSIFFTSFNVTPDVPQLFNSSNTITLDPFTISYVLTRQSSVTIQVLNTSLPPQVMRTIVSGGVRQNGILLTDVWDGRDDKGNFLPFAPGGSPYLVRVVAQDIASVLLSPSTAQQTVLYDPLRIYDLAVTPNTGSGAIVAYQVSEPMKVAIKVYKPGTNFDASGNPSPPEVDANGHYVSLVRTIVGIRPSRTPIQDVWDGRDFTLQPVADGTYKFKIIGSTDGAAIDNITGNALIPSELADDRLTDDMPSTTNGATGNDPVADFEGNTFVYPNPITGPSGTFSIYSPFRARVLLKLYTISGQLILSKDFGEQAPSFQNGAITYVWGKVNQSGRPIARGLYYAVIRLEETEGGANVLQTVKKVLVP